MFDWTDEPRSGQVLLDVGCASGNDLCRDLDCSIVGLDEDPAVFGSQLPPALAPRYHRVVGTAINVAIGFVDVRLSKLQSAYTCI